MIRLIAGISLDRAIGVYEGRKGKLPWGAKEAHGDLALFRSVTDGDTVIMGRKTFESIGSKPLAGRRNIIISRDHSLDKIALTEPNVHRALKDAPAFGNDIWVMGGTEVFREAMEYADEIFLTIVPFKAYEKYDTSKLVYFPTVNNKRFSFRKSEDHPINSGLRIIRYGTTSNLETIDELRRAYEESRPKVRAPNGKKHKGKAGNRKSASGAYKGKNPLVQALEDALRS